MIRRLTAGLVATVTMVLAVAPLQARRLPPATAPAAWLRYAETASQEVSLRLQADGDGAIHLRSYFDATQPAPDQPATSLLLKIWVNRSSVITRLEAPSLTHVAALTNLRGLIIGQRLPGSPPRGMLLPLRIAVSLDPSPQSTQQTPLDDEIVGD